ncbi:MAG TPA: FAD-dependent oxidoreductase, partial [Micromonospora sp.]
FGVRSVDGAVTGLVGDEGGLRGVELDGGAVQKCDSVFVAPRPRPNDGILRALGCEQDSDTGWVRVGASGAASVPGVWAAGNVTNPRAQVVTAAGEASAAAIAVTAWLLEAVDLPELVGGSDTCKGVRSHGTTEEVLHRAA